MTIEQLADEDVYNGPVDEKVSQQTFDCTGVLRVVLQPGVKTMRMLNIGGLDLDISYINTHLTIGDELEAWNQEQAGDLWHKRMKREQLRIKEELAENGVDAEVNRVSDHTHITLKET